MYPWVCNGSAMQSLKRQILIITVICAAIMELIDTSIVNVALSHMSGNLGATLEDTSWVITSYAIANVIVIPITSFLSAKLGRRNYYIGKDAYPVSSQGQRGEDQI